MLETAVLQRTIAHFYRIETAKLKSQLDDLAGGPSVGILNLFQPKGRKDKGLAGQRIGG